MARPQKFRHSVEALSDPQVAEKLGRFVIDIETLRTKRKQIDDQIAAAYDAVDDGGFEKKFVRKVVALRAKEEGARHEEEANLEAYEIAVEKGVSLACARRNGNASYSEAKGRGVDAAFVNSIRVGGELTDNQESGQPDQAVALASAAGAPDEMAAQDDVGATASSTHSPAELLPSEAITAGEAAQAPQAQASPAAHSDDDIPAFIKKDKPDCLKLKDGHCRLSFATSALCAECNQHRAISRASA